MAEIERQPSFWIIVGSVDNYLRTTQLGFTVQGMKSRHRKKAERMGPGDQIAYYLTGIKGFAGVATVTSPFFESHERIWTSGDPTKATEDYPYRVKIRPEVTLTPEQAVPAEGLARQMEYAAKWPAANWTLAFQGNVHEIGRVDFAMIQDAIAERAAALAGAGGND